MRPIARAVATLLTILWIATPLATALDGAATDHAFCPTHQAFEHADASESSGQGRNADLTAERSQSHQACALAEQCLAGAPAVTRVRPLGSTLPFVRAHVPALPVPPLVARHAWRDLAPKTSPPSLATV